MQSIIFEDQHLLVVDKPPGWNTHAPAPFANEGLYDWLKHREPRWSHLSILQRLDKETSGLILFGKTSEANRSLSRQFQSRQVFKKYLLLTDRQTSQTEFTARSHIIRVGDKYFSRPSGEPAHFAETHFKFISGDGSNFLWEAKPITGRTHQIRIHSAEKGIPILGDSLYLGGPAPRLCLHAAELAFAHPAARKPLVFHSSPRFAQTVFSRLRKSFIDPTQTNAFRLVHGVADGWPDLFIDCWNDFLLVSSEKPLSPSQLDFVRSLPARGAYLKTLARGPDKLSPQLIFGEPSPASGFSVCENSLNYKIRFDEGYSVGLFLDQRDNRRRLLTSHVAADFDLPSTPAVLNLFAYTCAFSVCAARRGARTVSVDLSSKYLDWGRDNFRLNNIAPEDHEFLSGDVFQWLTRLVRKGRAFDLIILDPPTFSRSKESGVFQAEKHYNRLISAALPLLASGGILFASANAATYPPDDFVKMVTQSFSHARRRILSQHYAPQPPDFPIHRAEPAYLKTIWVRAAN